MAVNLDCEIVEGENVNPSLPNPWQIQMGWYEVDEETNKLNLIRTWTVDAPSELVAKTIKLAMDEFSDDDYSAIMTQGYVR